MQEIQYYADEEGRKPVQEFIDALDCKMQAKVFGWLELLEEYGPMLGMPLAKHLDDGIFELRTVQGNNITRILYFFVVGKTIVLTQKTPAKEIERTKRMRLDWRRRNE